MFDFWKTIAYRVRICNLPHGATIDTKAFIFELYLYHIDESKSKTVDVYKRQSEIK